MFRQKSWVDEANDYVKITDVLTSIGVFVPSSILSGGNKKIYCPFGFYHSDGGISKAMRVYLKTNTIYCFSCSKSYHPVALAAAHSGKSWNAAALDLLEFAGYKPKTIDQRWKEATSEVLSKPDILALAEALKTYCSRLTSAWITKQLDEDVAQLLNRCLSLLDSVQNDEDAKKWLETTKIIMARKLT